MDPFDALSPQGTREEVLLGLVGLLAAVLLALVVRLGAPRSLNLRLRAAIVLITVYAAALGGRLAVAHPTARTFLGDLAIVAMAFAFARLAFQLAFDVLLARSRRSPLPRIVRDLSQGSILFVAALASLHAIGVEPGQLLTTSALLSVVAGMALQDTLGNLVAGLAIQTELPFQVGDWIEVHGQSGHIGKVREINWRATRLHTLDNVDVIVPNGLLAKATITNYDRPHCAARRSIYFHTAYSTPPRRVHEIVLSAIENAPGVLETPRPSIVTFGFDESGVQFWVRYFIDDMGRRDAIDGGVRDRIWYSLGRAGLAFSVPNRNLELFEPTEISRQLALERGVEDRLRALAEIDLFDSLDPGSVRRLARTAKTVLFAPSETVIRQGERGDTMFVVRQGELAVRVATPNGDVDRGRLGPGMFFGEMSLLTGEPRRATVVAQSPCELLVLERDAFRDLLAAHPEIARTISERVIQREASLQLTTPAPELEGKVEAQETDLLDRIRRFFGLRSRDVGVTGTRTPPPTDPS